MKTADFIAEQQSQNETKPSSSEHEEKQQTSTERIAPWRWKKGQSGNPGGRPKRDIAREIAQAIFENNVEGAYRSLGRSLLKGNAYVFKELAERAYGKLKEVHEVTHVHQDVADADLNDRIAALERDLGLARAIDEAGRAGIAAAGTGKANGKAKDTDVLSR